MAGKHLNMKPMYSIRIARNLGNLPVALLWATGYGQEYQRARAIAQIVWNGIKPIKEGYITARRVKKLNLE